LGEKKENDLVKKLGKPGKLLWGTRSVKEKERYSWQKARENRKSK